MNQAPNVDQTHGNRASNPLSSEAIADRLNTSWLGRPCVVFDEVASTMDVARTMSEEGMEAGAVIVADRQHSGRGRQGRPWHSDESLGVWFSALLPDTVDAAVLPHLVAAGVRSALEGVGVRAALKWPNDVLAPFSNEELPGAGLPLTWPLTTMLGMGKIAGVLVEKPAGGSGPVIGAGVNVNHGEADFPSHVRETATSAYLATGAVHDRAGVLASILGEIERRYDKMRKGGKDERHELIDEIRRYSTVLGRRVAVTLPDGVSFPGEAQGINDDGSLVLDTGRERKVLHAGTVRLLVGGEDVR